MTVSGGVRASATQRRRVKVEDKKPPRPVDRHLRDVLAEIEGISAREVSRLSGNVVGISTITKWRAGKVARPQHYTMTAALAAVGREFRIVRIRTQ